MIIFINNLFLLINRLSLAAEIHLRIDRNFCSDHDDKTSIRLYPPHSILLKYQTIILLRSNWLYFNLHSTRIFDMFKFELSFFVRLLMLFVNLCICMVKQANCIEIIITVDC